MLRLRPYKKEDSDIIAGWIQDEDVFIKWGGELFGKFPITADVICDKYQNNNGGCTEPDNFYPWVAIDDDGRVVGHFIMRYINGDRKVLRFGWVIVDDSIRGKGYGAGMLKAGLRFAFDIFDADKVTIGVFENNDPAHNCYKKVGFADCGIRQAEPVNVIEMEILNPAK
ncbi:MAG: GNAT family N-acetyltransferase [Clostridiales bacterium]|nr:GNAT family N-acetyltransferase [Clostridiales bacterium]